MVTLGARDLTVQGKHVGVLGFDNFPERYDLTRCLEHPIDSIEQIRMPQTKGKRKIDRELGL